MSTSSLESNAIATTGAYDRLLAALQSDLDQVKESPTDSEAQLDAYDRFRAKCSDVLELFDDLNSSIELWVEAHPGGTASSSRGYTEKQLKQFDEEAERVQVWQRQIRKVRLAIENLLVGWVVELEDAENLMTALRTLPRRP